MHSVHPVTAETLPRGREVSEPAVLVWLGEIVIEARLAAQQPAYDDSVTWVHQPASDEAWAQLNGGPLSYVWQGGDPA